MEKSNISIIDGDTIMYLAGYNKKDEPIKSLKETLIEVDQIVSNIFLMSSAERYCGFLTDGSFRYKIATIKPYKGNRADAIKPKYFNTIKGYLRDEYKFTSIRDYEADDLCIMAHRTFTSHELYNPIIASPDKDLKQIAGTFYDYKKKIVESVSEEQADLNFWTQMLVGDTGDNIVGIPGIGPVKASKILESIDYDSHQHYNSPVMEVYVDHYGTHEGVKNYNETYSLLKMLDHLDGEFYYPYVYLTNDIIKDDLDNLW